MKLRCLIAALFICGVALCGCGKTDSEGDASVVSPKSSGNTVESSDNESNSKPGGIKSKLENMLGIHDDSSNEREFTQTMPQEVTPPVEVDYSDLYTLTIDDNNAVFRTGDDDDNRSLAWRIEFNGHVMLERGAENEYSYRYFSNDYGNYDVTLISYIDGGYKPVSNTVSYTLSAENPGTPGNVEVYNVKDKLKNIVKIMRVEDENGTLYNFENMSSYVGDFNQDGRLDGVSVYYDVTYDKILINAPFADNYNSSNVGFDNMTYTFWTDTVNKQTYLIAYYTENNGNVAYNYATGELLWADYGDKYEMFGNQVSADEFQKYNVYVNLFIDCSKADYDHVYVFENGKMRFEGIYD